jgi:hypothetical protein
MIMNTTGRRNSLGSGKNILMFGEDGLEVRRHSCTTIDIVCSVSVSLSRVRVFRHSTNKGFSLCYRFLIYVWGPTVVLGPISQGTN